MNKRCILSILSICIVCVLFTNISFAHPGRTDSSGGHYDRSTGEYHYHHGYSAHQHKNGVCPYETDTDNDSEEDNVYVVNKDSGGSNVKIENLEKELKIKENSIEELENKLQKEKQKNEELENSKEDLHVIYIAIIAILIVCIWFAKKKK